MLSSVGVSDDRIGIEVEALVVEDGMVLETVRKVARKADADDDEAEKRAREKRAKVSVVKGRCGHTGVGTPGGTPEHWGYTKNTWVYTPRSLNIVLGL